MILNYCTTISGNCRNKLFLALAIYCVVITLLRQKRQQTVPLEKQKIIPTDIHSDMLILKDSRLCISCFVPQVVWASPLYTHHTSLRPPCITTEVLSYLNLTSVWMGDILKNQQTYTRCQIISYKYNNGYIPKYVTKLYPMLFLCNRRRKIVLRLSGFNVVWG